MLNLAFLGGLWAHMQKKKEVVGRRTQLRRCTSDRLPFTVNHRPTYGVRRTADEKCRLDYTTPATISPRLSTMQCSVHSYPRQSRRVYGTGINGIREAGG